MQGIKKERDMARPHKEEHEKRTETVRARVTVAEKAYIKEQAQLAGLDVTEYLRRRALGYVVPPSPSMRGGSPGLVTELNRLGLELKAIGVNANQLAMAANSHRRSRVAWEDVVARIQELRGEVTAALEEVVLGDS